MEKHNDAFISEQVDEQIEQASRSSDTPGTEFILALKQDYEQEKELDAVTLKRVWERIAEIEGRHNLDYAGEKMRPGRPRRRKIVWHPVSLVAAIMVLIAATMGGLTFAVHEKVLSFTVGGVPIVHSILQPAVKGNQPDTSIYTHTQVAWGINSLDWSPDSKRIVSANEILQAWDATTGQHLITFKHGNDDTYTFLAARWSPDGTRIAATGDKVEIWNATTGKLLLTLNPSSVAANQTTAGQTTLASTSSTTDAFVDTGTQPKVQLLSSDMPANPAVSQSGGGNSIFALAWSPDSKYIAATEPLMGTGNAAVLVWNATTGKLVTSFSGQPTPAIAWSPNGKYIASANGSDVQIWKPMTGQIVATYHTMTASFVGLAWSHDSKRIAAYDTDGITHIWSSLASQDQLELVEKGAFHAPDYVSSPLAWSPDDKQIATVGDGVQLWDTSTGTLVLTYLGQAQEACSASFPPTPPASGSYNVFPPCVNTVGWSPDGRYIASGDGPGSGTQPSTVTVWKV